MVPDRQYAFDDAINYSVSDTDDIAEFPNQLLYARTIFSTLIYAIVKLSYQNNFRYVF